MSEIKEETDLSLFMKFVDHINSDAPYPMTVLSEHWGDMHGFTLSNNFAGTMNTSICFNFYRDGKWRCLVETSEDNRYRLFKKALKIELKHKSFWDFFKMWREAKK